MVQIIPKAFLIISFSENEIASVYSGKIEENNITYDVANSLKNNAEVEKAIDEDRKDIEEKISAKVCQDYIGKLIDLGVDVSDFSQQAQLIKNGQAMMLRAVDENGKRISFFADGDTVQVANNLFDQLETMRKDAMDTMSKRLARSSDYFIAKKYMYGYRDTIDNFKTMAKEYAYIEKTDGISEEDEKCADEYAECMMKTLH